MVKWLRWHCHPDTGFEIRALAVWGRARYLSVTKAPHNTDFHTWMGKKHFCFFQTAETGNRTPNSGVKGNGANHYPRAPAQFVNTSSQMWTLFRQSLGFTAYVFRAVQASRIDRHVILQRSYSVIVIYRKSPNPITVIPGNTRHLYNICTMLAERRIYHTNHGFIKKYIQYLQNIFTTKYRRSYTPSALATPYHKHIHAIFIQFKLWIWNHHKRLS